MKQISIILAHPPGESFNHAIAQAAAERLRANGHGVWFHDLYQEQFDPVIPAGETGRWATLPPLVQQHCDEIARADGIILVHPNWWGQPPAILKGWVDRVLRPGVAYEFLEGDNGEGVPKRLLRARCALVFNTANTPGQREQTVFGDPLQRIWRDCIFSLCGVSEFYRRMFTVICTSTPQQRREWLDEAGRTVDDYFPAAFAG